MARLQRILSTLLLSCLSAMAFAQEERELRAEAETTSTGG